MTRVRVWVDSGATKAIHRNAVAFAPERETGGIVLGYWAGDAEAVVTHMTTPGPLAIHEPNRFVPDAAYDQREIDRIFNLTEGATTYLGDWHSHPRTAGYLSARDLRTLENIAAEPEAAAPTPLMFIVARQSGRWRLHGWRAAYFRAGPFRWIRTATVSLIRFG